MRIEELKKLKKMCKEVIGCVGCLYYKKKVGCSAINLNQNEKTYPFLWKLKPKKSKYKDKYYLGKKLKNKMISKVAKAFSKGFSNIKCYVWNEDEDKKRKEKVTGFDVERLYVFETKKNRYKNAEPILKEEESKSKTVTYVKSEKDIWQNAADVGFRLCIHSMGNYSIIFNDDRFPNSFISHMFKYCEKPKPIKGYWRPEWLEEREV